MLPQIGDAVRPQAVPLGELPQYIVRQWTPERGVSAILTGARLTPVRWPDGTFGLVDQTALDALIEPFYARQAHRMTYQAWLGARRAFESLGEDAGAAEAERLLRIVDGVARVRKRAEDAERSSGLVA